MKNKIKKYKFHIFALVILAGIILTKCRQLTLSEKLFCTCIVKDKKMTEQGGLLIIINRNNETKTVLDKQWYEKFSIGDTIK